VDNFKDIYADGIEYAAARLNTFISYIYKISRVAEHNIQELNLAQQLMTHSLYTYKTFFGCIQIQVFMVLRVNGLINFIADYWQFTR
jgi:hypothetical protein